eukprot:CAMPEP_0181505148 /NCGR_PEP_ID=MMETSP1110-20121109/57901_1 /TAXON_ID=174948 /ORGANISM="Symbiodinium sp., Strain CCMP421" /LENGTH=30 /DNA_ID= /DNA_START= /DNA_END= /DNA_ORIENTATION=
MALDGVKTKEELDQKVKQPALVCFGGQVKA